MNPHRPSTLDPSTYEAIAGFYVGEHRLNSYLGAEKTKYDTALAEWPAFRGNYSEKKTCDSCGAAFNYGALFLHKPSGELVHFGHICAGNSGMDLAWMDRVRSEAMAQLARERQESRKIVARFKSKCPVCEERISVGDPLANRNYRWMHEACADEEEAA